jgi:pilus assembly protein CpaF
MALKKGVNMVTIDNLDAVKLEQIITAYGGGRRSYSLRDTIKTSFPQQDATLLEEKVKELENDLFNLGRIQPFIDDDLVTEVIVNPDGFVWVEKNGRLTYSGLSLTKKNIDHLIYKITSKTNSVLDHKNPILNQMLQKNLRVNVVGAPVSPDGVSITIRKASKEVFSLESFGIESELRDFLSQAIVSGINTLIIGSTSSGKTALMRSLLNFVSDEERVIIVEDNSELKLAKKSFVNLETRSQTNSTSEVTLETLLKNTLRMRPDRIVVGEVRGSEAWYMLQGAITGHRGTITTIHGSDVESALFRLSVLAGISQSQITHDQMMDLVRSVFSLAVVCKKESNGKKSIDGVYKISGSNISTIYKRC